MGKRIGIIQSSYIPWKGYFDFINMVDEFVLFDDMQYTRRDWRNRNQIKTPAGNLWLTIPVKARGRFHQRVCDVEVEAGWASRHWETLRRNYKKASNFDEFEQPFSYLYEQADSLRFLSEVNALFIHAINAILGVNTPIRWSSEFDLVDGKTERLVHLCQDMNASEYLCGPTARGYIDEEKFEAEGIEISWMNYSGYDEYRQLNGPFLHNVSVLDLIFNEGAKATVFMKSFAHSSQTRIPCPLD